MSASVFSEGPLLGAAYYPEAWEEGEQERDIAMMVKAGIRVVRMGEFAWSRMEPREGEFHFGWLRRVIEKLAAAGIAVILGTPSATPPIWLEEKEPSIMLVDEYGRRAQHGGRRNNCSNNPVYRQYAARIAEQMAMAFGKDPRVIGWQIDNEIYTYGSGCYCEHCRRAFREHLQAKYGTPEQLNRRWNMALFSQWYDDFSQVPMPKPHIWHNPHLRAEWKEFISDSHVEFIRMQAEILRRYTAAPIGTDMMEAFGVSYEKIAAATDVIQFNHYEDDRHLSNAVYWFDYLRNLKERPFWNTETSTCWNGGVTAPENFRAEGFCTANSWLPVILGGEMNLYWLWRQHWAGHELMHGSVLYASGRPMHMFHEVAAVAEGFRKAGAFLAGTRVQADAAMLLSTKSERLFDAQHIAVTTDAKGDGRQRFHRAVSTSGLRPDLIPPGHDFSGYRLLFLPYVMTLEEENLPERIARWVKAGGVLVAGPLTDLRDGVGAHFRDRETGMLEELTGCRLEDQLPDAAGRLAFSWEDGTPFTANHFVQLFAPGGQAEAFVRLKSGFSSLIGKAVVLKCPVGKGTVFLLGTLPGEEDAARLMRLFAQEAALCPLVHSANLVAARRQGERMRGIAVQEIEGKPGEITLPAEMTDILTGQIHRGKTAFAPYETKIFCEKSEE